MKRTDEEPDPNFFGLRYVIPVHLNAAWELIRSMVMGYIYGPEYQEGWFSFWKSIKKNTTKGGKRSKEIRI